MNTQMDIQIPHELDIHTPRELHAALVCFPLLGCFWEADCLISAALPGRDPIDMENWQVHWTDVCKYMCGYSFTRLLSDISPPEVWETDLAQTGFPYALKVVTNHAIDAFMHHDGNYLNSLTCFMARLQQTARRIESEYGYPRGLITSASDMSKHFDQVKRHRKKCL